MSKNETISAIVSEVMKNDQLKQAVQDLNAAAKASDMSQADHTAKLQALLKDAGIEASEEDVASYLRHGARLELSEDDLDNVSGGCSSSTSYTACPQCGSTNINVDSDDRDKWGYCNDCGCTW